MAAIVMRWVHRLLVVGMLLTAVVYLPGGVRHSIRTDDLARVRRERQSLIDNNARIREEIEMLRAEVRALKQDPRELARIAREELNLVHDGEVVFEVRALESAP